VNIFLAGATGVIGRRLVPLLKKAGHTVTGTTRSKDKVAELEALGARAEVVDVFDAAALEQAVKAAAPEIVIHQLTDLPDTYNPFKLLAALPRNSRVRIEGTKNLIAAARAAGARRIIAQSIAFAYARGGEPHTETDPLASGKGISPGAISARGVRALEKAVTESPDGMVLRYGRLYGPGTWSETPNGRAPLHVDAAAHAALLAVSRGSSGIYNIAEDDGAVSIEKARAQLGFDPHFRIMES
jgi:nucleoside-diphosphate-sugar epimerase